MHFLAMAAGLVLFPAGILLLLGRATARGGRLFTELASVAYIALIACVAEITGASYILFPELGALAHDVFGRPQGRWARSPVLLTLTPVLTAAVGTLITRHLSYGLASVLLSVGCALLVIRLLKSPVAPAISAGLLPLALGVSSWWYPPAVLFGAAVLAGLSVLRARLFTLPERPVPLRTIGSPPTSTRRSLDTYFWLPWFVLFLLAAYAAVVATGWRFLLYPPLVVIGFEMLAHTDRCPWSRRPLLLSLVCVLTASGGMGFFVLFGAGPLAAAASMAFGVAVLRITDLHVPPALAVGLLPLIIGRSTPWYPVAVGLGTLILSICFLLYQRTALSLGNSLLLPQAAESGAGDD